MSRLESIGRSEMSKRTIRPLSCVADGHVVSVVSLTGGRGMQTRVTAMGLYVGKKIRVLHGGAAGGGPTLVAIDDVRLAIGHGMAQKVLVAVRNE